MLGSKTQVAELKNGDITVYQLEPEDVGIESQTLKGLVIDSSAESLALIQSAFNPDISESSPDLLPKKFQSIQKARAMIALNAGAAIYVSGRADSLGADVSMAETVIQNGLTLKKIVRFSQIYPTVLTLGYGIY